MGIKKKERKNCGRGRRRKKDNEEEKSNGVREIC